MPEYETIARLSEVPSERPLMVHHGSLVLAVFRTANGVSVLDSNCPHKGGPLALGWVENGRVFCPLHGWEFDIISGHCFTKPEKPARVFPSRLLNDEIQIVIP